ncbi:glycoside hydrolase family 16 protein [Sphingomonas sp. MMS24-JH45]
MIEARAERLATAPDHGGQDYTSARLISRPRHGLWLLRGAREAAVRARHLAAVWLLPDKGRWPAMGEIDIMEMVGWDANVVHATLHSGAYRPCQGHAARRAEGRADRLHRLPHLPARLATPTSSPSESTVAAVRVHNDQPGGRAAWPFDRPYRMILNVAVGGDWGGRRGSTPPPSRR